MATGWLVVGAVTAAGVLFFAAAMAANRVLRPRVPTLEKVTTYESGVDPVGRGWSQTNVRYYLYAFLYVVFAVDAVYLFPWATVVEAFGWATVAEMGVFLGILAVGLLHAWRRGALAWQGARRHGGSASGPTSGLSATGMSGTGRGTA